MKKWKHRRKLSNFIIDRGSFARLSSSFLIMSGASIGIVFAMRWEMMRELEKIRVVGAENLPVLNGLHELESMISIIALAGVLLLSVLCFGLLIVTSHKVFGPTVPMRRHIQNMIAGDSSSRMTLRAGDEFKEICADLNLLAEKLEDDLRSLRKTA